MSKPRAVWAKQPRERGLAGVCHGTRGFDLRVSGEVVIRVRITRSDGGWYWYGMGHNSLWDGGMSMPLDRAKSEAMDHYRKIIAKQESDA